MKKVMTMMTLLMGVTMSLVLSVVGTALGGHFTVQGWLVSFLISLVISLIIGFTVPVKRISDGACKKAGLEPASFKGNLLSACISDLIYTPVITIIMVTVMISAVRRQLAVQGIEGGPSIAQALPLSLIVCLIVGFIVIAAVQPVFIKMLTKNMPKPGKRI